MVQPTPSDRQAQDPLGLLHDSQSVLATKNGVIDPTENKITAIQAASEPAGEYLETISKSDLAQMEEAEWFTFLEVVITASKDKLRSFEASELPS
jgi:Family of unknown function (DUF6511)